MKSVRLMIIFLWVCLFIVTASSTAWAAEAWTTDPKTGCKIGLVFLSDGSTLVSASWSGPVVDGKAEGKGTLTVTVRGKDGKDFQGQGEAEMIAGLLDGKNALKWSNGDSYDGYYKAGLREGKGIYKFTNGIIYEGDWKNGVYDGKGTIKWPDGRTYDGDWKDGKHDGKGVMKWPDGQIYDGEWKNGDPNGVGIEKIPKGDVYDGEWKDGKLEGKGTYKWPDGKVFGGAYKNGLRNGYGVLKDASGKVLYEGEWKDDMQAMLKADKILGIPWGATDEQARSILLQRPNTKSYSFMNGKDAYTQWKGYYGPFADFNDAEIWVHFYQDKMWQVQVSWALKEDAVLERFNAVKQGLTERYGAPASDKGKYLDSIVIWDLGGGYSLNVEIRKNTIKYIAGTDPSLTYPFRVFIFYYNQAITNLINKTATPGGVNKDY